MTHLRTAPKIINGNASRGPRKKSKSFLVPAGRAPPFFQKRTSFLKERSKELLFFGAAPALVFHPPSIMVILWESEPHERTGFWPQARERAKA
jgi:hypothetical protein